MNLRQRIINSILPREFKVINKYITGNFMFDNISEDSMPFSNLIFLNICDLLTDLTNDVTFTTQNITKEKQDLFVEFNTFFNVYGKYVLNMLYSTGYVVIGHGELGFKILDPNEYTTQSKGAYMVAEALNPNIQVYVMRSEAFTLTGSSDKMLLNPFLKMLDNVLNGSNTIAARLGAVVIGAPKQVNNIAPDVLTVKEKESVETDLSENYGMISSQKQFKLFARPMDFTTINLAGIDNKMVEKVKTCVLAIADRIKVPANQIALIDALSSKAFANGSEMVAGDFAKYQSYERLLNNTFVNMANQLGLKVQYTIYNKPTQQQTTPQY